MKNPIPFFVMALVSTYVCVVMVFWPELMLGATQRSIWAIIAYYLCPWILLACSLKGYHLSGIWRRMLNARKSEAVIMRGDAPIADKKQSISVLEILCFILGLIAIASLIVLFNGPLLWRGY